MNIIMLFTHTHTPENLLMYNGTLTWKTTEDRQESDSYKEPSFMEITYFPTKIMKETTDRRCLCDPTNLSSLCTLCSMHIVL